MFLGCMEPGEKRLAGLCWVAGEPRLRGTWWWLISGRREALNDAERYPRGSKGVVEGWWWTCGGSSLYNTISPLAYKSEMRLYAQLKFCATERSLGAIGRSLAVIGKCGTCTWEKTPAIGATSSFQAQGAQDKTEAY